jgi:hypothetical protein
MRVVVRVEAGSDAPQAAERARVGPRVAPPPERVADLAPGASGPLNRQPRVGPAERVAAGSLPRTRRRGAPGS